MTRLVRPARSRSSVQRLVGGGRLEPEPAVGIVLDHDRIVALGEIEQRMAPRQRERAAAGILEGRDRVDQLRRLACARDEIGDRFDHETVRVDRAAQHAPVIAGRDRDAVRIGRAFGQHEIAWAHEQFHREVEPLRAAGGDDQFVLVERDTVCMQVFEQRRAQHRLALGRPVAERGIALLAISLGRKTREQFGRDRLGRRRAERERHHRMRLLREQRDRAVDRRTGDAGDARCELPFIEPVDGADRDGCGRAGRLADRLAVHRIACRNRSFPGTPKH